MIVMSNIATFLYLGLLMVKHLQDNYMIYISVLHLPAHVIKVSGGWIIEAGRQTGEGSRDALSS